MNPYTDPVTCDVCGEPGVAWAGTGYRAWIGGRFRHKDPQVCADNLEYRRRELDRREAQLATKQATREQEEAVIEGER